jgi:chromosome segregation ATPase
VEGDVVHIEVEKPRINPAHFIAILGSAFVVVAVNAFALGAVWVNLNNTIATMQKAQDALSTELNATRNEFNNRFAQESADRKDRQKVYQATLDDMNTRLGQISPLQFQQTQMIEKIAENKTANAETNKRIDRIADSVSGKLDGIGDVLNKLTTRVEVLNSKMDEAANGGNPKRTLYNTPVVRPR